MNLAWRQYKQATQAVGKWTTRKEMRVLLRTEDGLSTVRKGVFGAWRRPTSS